MDRARQDAGKYGIDPEQVERAVTDRDSISEPLETPWASPVYTLHAAEHLSGTEPEYYVVTVAREGRSGPVAAGVHVVPAGFYERERRSPKAMLSRLANEGGYGLGVQVWGNVYPFLAGETVHPAQAREEGGVEPARAAPDGHEVVLEDRFRIVGGEIQVSLAFAIDATAVRDQLGFT